MSVQSPYEKKRYSSPHGLAVRLPDELASGQRADEHQQPVERGRWKLVSSASTCRTGCGGWMKMN